MGMMQRWHSGTGRSYLGLKFPGLLSCAYTVSAIFHAASHPIGRLPSVRKVDRAIADWPKVSDPRLLERGDVVFWRPTGGTILGIKCPGHWHVGISLGGDVTVDNDWWSGKPQKNTLDRACVRFAYARRAPR
jgi:cell wall-associated NlpC family hydrolase